MILPDFVLPSRANQCWQTTGMDSEELCRDLAHFKSYPYTIEYLYNDRGYRDDVWPEDLRHAVWCMGDSFTVGIGSPRQHTWTYLLQQALGQRTINVSMDGASNMWIARKALRVLEQLDPRLMIIHWSYVNRRERDIETELDQSWNEFYNNVRDSSWPDCLRQHRHLLPAHIQQELIDMHGQWDHTIADDQRLIHHERCTDNDDLANTLHCIQAVNKSAQHTQIIHSFIPGFVPDRFKGVIESQVPGQVIPETPMLDLARDGHHYDRITAEWLVDQIRRLL